MMTMRVINTWTGVLDLFVILSVRKHPEAGSPVPKHVGVYTYHELNFMICTVSYFI